MADDVNRNLDQLRQRFVQNTLRRFEEIEALLRALRGGDHEAIDPLYRHYHGLAGLGGSYGFNALSAHALTGERALDAARTKDDTAELPPLLEELLTLMRSDITPRAVPAESVESPESGAHPELRVLLVTKDDDLESRLRTATEIEGVQWIRIRSVSDATASISSRTPDGLVTEIHLDDGTGYELVELLRARPGGEHSLAIVVSGASEFLDKVEAMRSGADAFFERPFDASAVVRRIRQLLDTAGSTSRRVLAVEDDPDQQAFYEMVLSSAGYEVLVCGNPREFESMLASWHPDLVLMDVHLPEVSGYDLSRWMRQHEAWAMVPIIFVTTASPVTSRIESMRAGGDDYLVKPVTPALLLSAVAARMERARFLRMLLERDGLTGLLTHSAFMERLKARFSQSRRSALISSALAMIDLDYFKTVNDQYGHLTGDRVLVGLAALLRSRLRQSDTIGRYGGEEFAILIDDLNEGEAMRLIERLREDFAAIEHEIPGGTTFSATFSAGVAILDSETETLEQWIDHADRALYRAKNAGRNRVELAKHA